MYRSETISGQNEQNFLLDVFEDNQGYQLIS